MDGYLDDPEATAAAFRGGWLHTGDLGRLDEDGMLHIVGRLKEMIRTGGVNVYPREVAARLGEHPAIRDCAVFGVPDPRYDERVVAAVVSDDPGLTPDEVVRWVRERMAGYQTPRQVILLDALPKTAAGKTAMADLIDRARRSAGADGERSAS
jgi:acyl-CoA synthetase (AMP-forming)/AMP-acid ligase II